MADKTPKSIFWIDLETAGLVAVAHQILEIAVAEAPFTDPFNLAWRYHAVLELERPRDRLSVEIKEMHTKNRLLDECERNGMRLTRVIEDLHDIIPAIADEDEKPLIGGLGVHFDHEFLRHYMPAVAKRFSHRHYDVSAVKLFCRSHGMARLSSGKNHRAKGDVLEAIEHAKLCAEWMADHLPQLYGSARSFGRGRG